MAHLMALGNEVVANALCSRYPDATFTFTVDTQGRRLVVATARPEHLDWRTNPELVEAAAAVADAARTHGKAAGVLVGNLDQLRPYQEAGFRFLGCNSDSGLLMTSAGR